MLFSRQQAIARSAQVSPPHLIYLTVEVCRHLVFSHHSACLVYFQYSRSSQLFPAISTGRAVPLMQGTALQSSRAAALGAGANQALVSQKVACTLRGNTGIAYLLFLKRKLPETQAL